MAGVDSYFDLFHLEGHDDDEVEKDLGKRLSLAVSAAIILQRLRVKGYFGGGSQREEKLRLI